MKRLLTKACILATSILCAAPLTVDAYAQTPAKTDAQAGQLTDESLGNLLRAMGLKPKQQEKRYDFRFKAILDDNEWELSMSAVLSQNKKSIWVMAWLDELPKSAANVPRTALLRLLAANDRMGKGKFFAYIASNRRFVLQRVIPNENMTTAAFRDVLKDLGTTVVMTYPYWSVANWKNGGGNSSAAQNTGAAGSKKPAERTTRRDSKFSPVRRN